MKSNYGDGDSSVKGWETEFVRVVQSLIEINGNTDNFRTCLSKPNGGEESLVRSLRITYATSQSLDQEMASNIMLDTKLIVGTFILIILFAVLLMSLNTTCTTSPGVFVPLTGVFSAIFSLTSSFGLLGLLGYPACNLILVIPFLVLGIGIDDMFIIYASFAHQLKRINMGAGKKRQLGRLRRLQQPSQPNMNDDEYCNESRKELMYLSDLMSNTLSHSGVSITITSLTDFVAFMVGITTSFRSVQIFCVYAGLAIFICYLNQLTIYCGFLCIHAKLINKKRNGFLFCLSQNYLSSVCSKCCCPAESDDDDDDNNEDNNEDNNNAEANQIEGNIIEQIDGHGAEQTIIASAMVAELQEIDSSANLINKRVSSSPTSNGRCKANGILSGTHLLDDKKSSNATATALLVDAKSSKLAASSTMCKQCAPQSSPVYSMLSKSMKSSTIYFKRFWKSFFKFVICTKRGKCSVAVVYTLYILASLYSANQIKEGINLADLVADDSYYHEYISESARLTDLSPIVMFVIDEPLDYNNISIRKRLNNIINDAMRIEGVKKGFVLNWLEIFKNRRINYKQNQSVALDELKSFPPFMNDLIFTEVNKNAYEANQPPQREFEISASRFFIQYDRLHFSSKDAKPMNQLRELCKQSGLPIYAYSIVFKFYEQFEQTLPNIIQAFIIAIEAMYLIALMFIPDLVSVFCIIFSMGSIMIGLVGLMNVWGLTLSSITMIELVMSIGFCVDFSAHITHAFLNNSGKGSRSKRAYKACMRVGFPIFNSAFSTIVGIFLLGLAKSYIFMTFFKTMVILMCLGVLNSLVFLPVLLSVVGPHWPRHKEKSTKSSNAALKTSKNSATATTELNSNSTGDQKFESKLLENNRQ
jgi:predicted RND superfamily exporter protein